MYTYGCPRVGNPAFYDSYNAFDIEHYRVVHNKDIVPHLPLEVMGFHHTNQEIWYSTEDSSTFIECDDSGEDGNCSNSLTFAMSSSDHCEYVGKPICACADTFEEVLEKIGGEVVEKVGGFLRGTVIVD
jgi:hypothetical protein